MSEGARSVWSKRGCGDSQRRDQGKHKQRKCERPLSMLSAKLETGLEAPKRCVMSGGEVEVYLSQVHDGSVSSGFRALYEERLLLDVTLLIEEHHFHAHKALLATQSDYFRVMFTADMRERDQDKIHMKGLTAAGFGHVLRFMYYGSLELSMVTVQEILQAAMYVQLTEVVEFCCSFLLSKICLENCAEVMRLLEDFSVGVEGVQEQLDNFLLENFVPLMSKPDFLLYLSLERLQAYLDSDALSRFPEIELYESVQAWLRHDRRRWRHTDTVVQSLRFCLMTAANVFEKVWWELEGPQVPLRPDCLAIVNNFAFLLGGEELGPDGEFHASSKVYRYDPRQNSWLRMADMSVPRSEFAVGVIGKFIYAVAGRTRDETFYSTERYDITADRWEFVDPYPVNKYGHEGTVLNGKLYITGGITSSSTSKQVCVFDPGRDEGGGVCLFDPGRDAGGGVCVFDPGRDAGGGLCVAGSAETTDTHRTRSARSPLLPNTHTSCWENKSKMNYARCFHKMISHNGKLYVFGGVCVILRASFESQGCPSTEVYDPETDEWTILASMPIGRSGHGVAVLDRQIMVLGGLCYNGHYSDSILTFDPDDNKWKEDEYPRMPCKLDGLQVCTLHFPEYVLEHVRRCS
ncbi:kelch-like protein 15 isoform X5 [Oncorhynchus keta]|uniref:kelch-like protein 15 isoform X5 n=1 Tax=Oncorhynchus keta TaxID=8018 RepID=UPI00227C3C86|nr:kelch-like protein 15 isoform X5 [Oncorhynchus keta]